MSELTEAPAHPRPFIYETPSSKSLFFSSVEVQSRMDTLHPDALQFEYTRLMMGFLLFKPQPRSILMIGLGGGSLAKYCYRHLVDTRITVVEINPHVIALRRKFEVPENDERFHIVEDDAANFVGTTDSQFDVMLVDGFDLSGIPEQLSTLQFYDNCKSALTSNGVFVANLHRKHQLFDVYIDRMEEAFGVSMLQVTDPNSTNCIAFAGRKNLFPAGRQLGLRRPEQMDEAAWREILPSVMRVFLASRSQYPLPNRKETGRLV